MPLVQITDESLRQAARLLTRGGLVAFPTETVYGLGADAFNPAALAAIFDAKNRPRFDPLIIHLADIGALETVADLSLLDAPTRKNLAALTARFWPGPLTVIVPKQKAVPDLATSGLSTVAVRVPRHDAARKLIALSTGALAAPSANPFGALSPTRAEHVLESLGAKIDLILDGGPTEVGLESTVLDLCGGRPCILRPGGAPREAIESLIGPVASGAVAVSANDPPGGMASPGLLKSHYAPRAPLVVHGGEITRCKPENAGEVFLFFDGASRDAWRAAGGKAAAAVLSETGDAVEAAARLFETLRELDRPGVTRIHAQLAPQQGLGAAINDRLRRGSRQ